MRPVPFAVVAFAPRRPTICRLAICLGVAVCAALGGCASAGAVNISELNFKRIPAQGPLTAHVVVEQCAWRIDEERICVGLRYRRPGLFGESGREQFDFSLVLPGIPAARARDYRLDAQSVRCYLRRGASHARFASIYGIVGIWRESGEVLHGKFRLIAGQQVFHVLTGWSSVGQVYMEGEFRARRDPRLTEDILLGSEEDGMDRSGRVNMPAGSQARPVRVTGPPVGDHPP